MNVIKKTFAAGSAAAFYLSVAATSFAIDIEPAPHNEGNAPIIGAFPVDENGLVAWVISALAIIAVLAALLWLIIGAIKWIISGGDKEKVAAARSQIIAAIIGLIIVILSLVIINFVIGFFVPGANIWNLQLPTFQDAIDGGPTTSGGDGDGNT